MMLEIDNYDFIDTDYLKDIISNNLNSIEDLDLFKVFSIVALAKNRKLMIQVDKLTREIEDGKNERRG